MAKRRNARGGVKTVRRPANAPVDPKKKIAALKVELAQALDENIRLNAETREALERQTATAEILQVINSSPGNLAPVFETILEKAHSLCAVAHGALMLYDGKKFRAVAMQGLSEPLAGRLRGGYIPGPNHPSQRLLEGARFAQVTDWSKIDDPSAVAPLKSGVRTTLFIPLRKDGKLLGQIGASRLEVRPFTEKEIALLENFAAQAVIAMENARLFEELRQRRDDLSESLQQQTATADVLKVISRSTFDLQKVFDALTESACRVCGAYDASLFLKAGDSLRNHSHHGPIPMDFDTAQISRDWVNGRSVVDRRSVHVLDLHTEAAEFPAGYEMARRMGHHTILAVPLAREQEVIGSLALRRIEVLPFTDKQIALAETFAAQAVIAIENTRLLNELRQSLQQQTATADVLKTISRSSIDLETVLNTLVETVARLCRADQVFTYTRRDDKYHLVAAHGLSEEAKEFIHTHPLALDRGSVGGRVELERRAVHVPDILQDPEYTYLEGQKVAGFRTLLGIPLLREDTLVGIFSLGRTRVDPFTDREIELATSFADQAVIAIENARLFEELRERQAELRVTFDNMGDGVVMFDAAARLTAWNRNFQEMLDLPDAFLVHRPSYAEYFRYLADRGEYSSDLEAQLSRTIEDTSREMRFSRTRPDGRVIEVRRNPVPGGGFVLIYADITERKQAEEAIRSARDAAETALRELQTAQASLVHAQKMAALGQLTAGIAHEIKNPLNFVNNFAGISVELLDELKQAAGAVSALDPGKCAEIAETIGMLTGNMEKIVEHGRRADGIVRSMLQHSRGGSDDWQPTDLNALAEEALSLAYHGARAQDPNFNITLEHDLDRNLAPVDVVPQEITRVLLNLIGNGFYAANKRSRESDGTYRPALKVTTRGFDESVEVRVRDNGIGIPPENRDKLFQPFFTTKPTGEGTGLGLSISYEIVAQQHGGTLTVDSEVGDFTEFTVRLPRRRQALAGGMG